MVGPEVGDPGGKDEGGSIDRPLLSKVKKTAACAHVLVGVVLYVLLCSRARFSVMAASQY